MEDDWIAYIDNGNADNYYQKFGTIDDFYFNKGRAFWVMSMHNHYIDRSINAAQLNDFSEAEIGLHEGWNLITNPFNPTIFISYRLSAFSQAKLKVYNALGQHVRTLVSGRQKPAFSFAFMSTR